MNGETILNIISGIDNEYVEDAIHLKKDNAFNARRNGLRWQSITVVACLMLVIGSIMFMTRSVQSSIDNNKKLVQKSVEAYFDCFENANYSEMKQYCTPKFVNDYFHEEDVFGDEKGKL